MKAIEVKNLNKVYRSGFIPIKNLAVKDLTFSVEAGEIYGLLGPNGAGKTTTMKILVGLLNPSQGSASIFSHPAGSIKARSITGFLPENPVFYNYLSGKEFLQLIQTLSASSGTGQELDQIIKTTKIEKYVNSPIRSYSKGMLQRLGLAQALIGSPQILILDEPLSGVDPMGRAEIKEILRQLKKQEITLLICSHILPDIEEIADRVGLINQGQLILEDTLLSITAKYHKTFSLIVQADPQLPRFLEHSHNKNNLAVSPQKLSLSSSDKKIWKIEGEKQDIEQVLTLLVEKKYKINYYAPSLSTLEQYFLKSIENEKD
ncbi:MAG: ABC transporter ATP-binding protein [bacterium]